MNQFPGEHEITSAHTALEDARAALSAATQALENMPNPPPWSRERLNHAYAQDLLKHAQQRVDNLYSGRTARAEGSGPQSPKWVSNRVQPG